jgi:hypothetical protein
MDYGVVVNWYIGILVLWYFRVITTQHTIILKYQYTIILNILKYHNTKILKNIHGSKRTQRCGKIKAAL